MRTAGRVEPKGILKEIDSLFCAPGAPYGPYRRDPDGALQEVVPNTLYALRLFDGNDVAVTLQLYRGIESLGGALWTRAVRTLLRVSVQQHPSLPRIVSGAYVESYDLAFVVTEAARYTLSEAGAMEYIAQNREQALRQFTLLAHGLSLLHQQGITHGNLAPGTIQYVELGEDAQTGAPRFGFRLSGFEMSAMVSNLVRRQLAGEKLPVGDMRDIYLDAANRALPYCPPERAEWLFGSDDRSAFESDRSDVYALGVLGWRWLVEAVAEDESSYYQDQDNWAGLERSLDSVKQVHRYLISRLRNSRVPVLLADLLRSMLAWHPRERPNVLEVVRQLTQEYGRLVSSMAPPEEPRTFYLAYMPVESKFTVHSWGWISQDPREPAGQEELEAFLANELKSAELLYCPEGFTICQKPKDEKERRGFPAARYVLVGKQAYWFCVPYEERGVAFQSLGGKRIDRLLLIKYVGHHSRVPRLARTPLRRRIAGTLELVPVLSGRHQDLRGRCADGAEWPPVLQSVEHESTTPQWMIEMDDALSFLMEFERIRLDARCFPYSVLQSSGHLVDIGVDPKRDRGRQFVDGLRSLYFREIRIPMGRLFAGLDSEGSTVLDVFADNGGRPDYRRGAIATVVVHERLSDPNAVKVRVVRGSSPLPPFGWIQPEEDQSNASQRYRQETAVKDLLQARQLLDHLHNPSAIKGFSARWQGVGENLKGRSREIIKDLLATEPFYAIHGPPGTGKTTVAAHAVAAHLRSDKSQRVLVSSQSHYALDNLATAILNRCEADKVEAVAVRLASDRAVSDGKVASQLAELRPEQQATALVNRIVARCRQALKRGQLVHGQAVNHDLKCILEAWMAMAPRVDLEVRDRLRRGANIVFATTGGCTERNVGSRGANAPYDWVIVEEAARAWPSELAMPLVRGARWALIGDHFQLPAFDELSIQRFLELCTESPDRDVQSHGEQAATYMKTFKVFANLFDGRAQRRKSHTSQSRLVEPLDELDLQFRMHPSICRVVSRAFYRSRIDPKTGEPTEHPGGWLKTDESLTDSTHGYQYPGFVKDRALVWLDTTGLRDTNDERAWRNPGEALLVKMLLSSFREPLKKSAQRSGDALAILTPYAAQLAQLRSAGLPDWALPCLHTLDSFQGREADVVIVSLVRATQRDSERSESNIGYLVSPERINVLFSRARKLLVVVGRLSHFAKQVDIAPALGFWADIIDEVRKQDAVVSAATHYGEEAD